MFDRAARLATILLDTEITPYEIAMVQVALKMARLQESRTKDDNYIDAMNYLAMAAQFAPVHEGPRISERPLDAVMEADIAKIARQFAPKKAPPLEPAPESEQKQA